MVLGPVRTGCSPGSGAAWRFLKKLYNLMLYNQPVRVVHTETWPVFLMPQRSQLDVHLLVRGQHSHSGRCSE